MIKHHFCIVLVALFVAGQLASIASDTYGFSGQESISSCGSLFLRNRVYDPEVGVFVSRDPSGIGGGLNAYSYVAANPVNHVDPLGLAEVGVAFDPLMGSSANHAFS
ncbi:MAG: RHS repeat-associated core domain-containing protein [Verrucomicrobiae bacterium]